MMNSRNINEIDNIDKMPLDDKLSFDSEISLLESTLTEFKNEHSNSNNRTSPSVAQLHSVTISPNEPYISKSHSVYRQGSNNDNTHELHFCNNKNMLGSQQNKSINVSVGQFNCIFKPVSVSEASGETSFKVSPSKGNVEITNLCRKSRPGTIVTACDSSVEESTVNEPPLNNRTALLKNYPCENNPMMECLSRDEIIVPQDELFPDKGKETKIPMSNFLSCKLREELKDDNSLIAIVKADKKDNESFTNLDGNRNELSNNLICDVDDAQENEILNGECSSDERNDPDDFQYNKNNVDHYIEVEESIENDLLNDDDVNIPSYPFTHFENNVDTNKLNNPLESKNDIDIENGEFENSHNNDYLNKNPTIFSSTPIITSNRIRGSPEESDFDKITPLRNASNVRTNLKRKFSALPSIVEEEENNCDLYVEKKPKYDEDIEPKRDGSECGDNEGSISSSISCYEAPAKSILKKWQTSYQKISTLVTVDECSGSVNESKTTIINSSKQGKNNNNAGSDGSGDEFDSVCNSLNEELMKSSTVLKEDSLEKYYSRMQHETQIDGELFDEFIQELNLELGDDLPTGEGFVANVTSYSVANLDSSSSADKLTKINNLGDSIVEVDSSSNVLSIQKPASVVQQSTVVDLTVEADNHAEKRISTKGESNDIAVSAEHISDFGTNTQKTAVETIINDEEEILLSDQNSKPKTYEFQEFVSSDSKENEDNYNPEWKKLGQLTNDEERYKAVRDRWRSLIPPDPNRNLCYRQWREQNGHPPLQIQSRNNKYGIRPDNRRTQLCTAVYEAKIHKFVDELEVARSKLLTDRNLAFEELGKQQDDEQRMLLRYSTSPTFEMQKLQRRQIEDCREMKARFDFELSKLKSITQNKIETMNAAKQEVLLFQRFYKGFNDKDGDEVCLYMTDTQVKELMETEEMLESYEHIYSK